MSANNQTLVKEHKGKWLVFYNVMAESWCDWENWKELNTLKASEADAVCDSRDEAMKIAEKIDAGTEYGVANHLIKDGAEVTII